MARLIVKWRYIKPGAPKQGEHYVDYIATREGVEIEGEQWKDEPATKEQEKLVNRLIADFPDCKDSFEYQDYLSAKTKYTATGIYGRVADRAERIRTHTLSRTRNVFVPLREREVFARSHRAGIQGGTVRQRRRKIMAVPIIPILKKIGTAVLSNKKGRKVIGGIILGTLVLLMTPAAVVLGIFSGSMDINTDGVQTIVKDRQETEEKRYAEIEQAMTEAEYSEIKIREAQAIYSFALFNLSGDDVAEKLTECFLAETDEDLAEKINGAFYTAFSVDEISAILESVRQEYG